MEKTIIDIDEKSAETGSKTRKEIIYISGTHFLIGAIVIMNAVIAAGVWRYHNAALFEEAKRQNDAVTVATRSERDAKNDILTLENVKTWKDTAYAKARPWTAQDER